MTAAVRKVPDSTNGTLPYDGETWQRNVNSEVIALWQVATTRLVSVSGTNDITATSDTALVAAIAAYAQPMSFWVIFPNANTGGMTLNIDGVGVVYLKDKAAATLVGGAVDGVSQYLICFDGAGFRIHGTSSSSSGSANTAPDMILRDEKTTGTAGGTFTGGSFAQRVLNTSVRNVLSGASLSGNQFTLQAGTYLIEWSAPAFSVGSHQTRLFNATDSITVETGTSESTSTAAGIDSRSQGKAVVTITSAKAFEIDHICGSTGATTGFGNFTNLAAKEVYTTVYIWKVGSLPSQVNGVPGGAVTWPVIFDTSTTDADPGTGKLRLGSASQFTSTILYVDLLDANGTDVTSVIDSFNPNGGQVRLVKYDDPTKWLMFSITGWTTASGYRKLTLVNVGAPVASPFALGDRLYFAFTAAGTPLDVTANHTWSGLNNYTQTISVNGFPALGSNGSTTPYISIEDTAGNAAMLFGGGGSSPDHTNYYRNTSHSFQNIGGATQYGTLNGSGLSIIGFITATGAIVSSGGGVGYTTGAGGTVVQAPNKTTGVTLNKPSGQITMNGAALASNAVVSFVLTNSAIAATDTLSLQFAGTTATLGAYILQAQNAAAGSVTITVRNVSGGSLSESPVIQFNVVKGAIT